MRVGRDFQAELDWLLRLPAGPETDRKQADWDRDPEVVQWRARRAAQERSGDHAGRVE